VDGRGLAARRRHHGYHDHRPALGARSAYHGCLYVPPFGHTVVERPSGIGSGPLGCLGNIIWLVLAGWWLALGHLITALCLAVTIIGLPFAWAHLKLAGLALWPIGKDVVSV
jgi:uncharacterized membrane protein YccF (DUF307 family)